MTVAARITCETLPGLLRDFRTASDKSCGRGLGTRLDKHTCILTPLSCGLGDGAGACDPSSSSPLNSLQPPHPVEGRGNPSAITCGGQVNICSMNLATYLQ